MKRYFSGTLRLIRLIIRRERIITAVWLASLAGITAAVAGAYAGMFSAPEDILSMAVFFDNPAMTAMLGPLYGGNNLTTGALLASSMLLFTAVAAGIMNIFFVVRNTRGDEEKGRTEVIRSPPVGRLSNLSATLAAAFAVNLILALLTGFILPLMRIESVNLGGSMLYGFTLGAAGMFFAAAAAVFSQIASNSRGAAGFSFALLGFLYMLRAVGDIGREAVSMVSPLGMILRVQCFVENIWWPVFAVLLIGAALAALAFYLNSVRDSEQGLLPQRYGRREASGLLRTPEGLALRLLRNTIIAWAAGLVLIAVSYGAVMGDMESFISSNELLKNALTPPEGHTQTEMFITMIISMLAIASAIPSAGAVLRLAGEERHHRYENIFSKAVSRERLMTGYLVIGLSESVILLFLAMSGLWAAASGVMKEPVAFGSLFSAIMIYLPAVWVIIGIAVILTGLMPEKASAAVYGYIGFSFIIIYLGAILKFPGWVKYLTPFGYIPKLPIDPVNFVTLILLTLAAAAFAAGGYILYKRRDLQ